MDGVVMAAVVRMYSVPRNFCWEVVKKVNFILCVLDNIKNLKEKNRLKT